MADQCQATKSAPRDVPVSSALPIAVLSLLAAMGTLATNILLPSLPQIAISLNVTSAAVTSAITVFLAVFGLGQLVVGPLSDRYGRRWPVLIGFAVFFGGSVWCGLATDLPNLLAGRVVQAAGACATSVLARAIARDMFRGPALARAMALIMIAMSAAPGFSPLLGGALDHSFGWRSEFALVAAFAAAGAIAYSIILGETHNSIRTPFNLVAIAKTYVGLLGDRRFAIPAATASLIIGGLFSMFSAAPRLFIEAMHFTPIQLGLFFAGTVFIVFAAGMLATKLAPRYGLDRPIRAGLWATAASSVAILLISMISPTFLPFLGAMCVFLLGMGVVSPLATARALSPFGEKAGAASALLGATSTGPVKASTLRASVTGSIQACARSSRVYCRLTRRGGRAAAVPMVASVQQMTVSVCSTRGNWIQIKVQPRRRAAARGGPSVGKPREMPPYDEGQLPCHPCEPALRSR